MQEKAILRRLIRTATEIVGKSYDYIEDVEEFLDEAEQAIFEVAGSKNSGNFIVLKEALEETFERLDQLKQKKAVLQGCLPVLKELDNLTSGLQDSDLIIVAARPSMGKTTLALNIAQEISVNKNYQLLF